MKSLTDGVVVHDESYCAAVQLEGPEACIFFLHFLNFIAVSSINF